jgi:hypothetical protein
MQRDELAAALFASAQAHADEQGMRLHSLAESEMRRLTLQAAQRMLLENPEMDRGDPLLRRAETAFQRLVDEMVHQGPRYRGDEADDDAVKPALREDTLRRALKQLCPLFPIC